MAYVVLDPFFRCIAQPVCGFITMPLIVSETLPYGAVGNEDLGKGRILLGLLTP